MLEPQVISSFRTKGLTSGLQTCGRLIWPEKLNCSTLWVCFICKQLRLDSALALNSQQVTPRFIGFTLFAQASLCLEYWECPVFSQVTK